MADRLPLGVGGVGATAPDGVVCLRRVSRTRRSPSAWISTPRSSYGRMPGTSKSSSVVGWTWVDWTLVLRLFNLAVGGECDTPDDGGHEPGRGRGLQDRKQLLILSRKDSTVSEPTRCCCGPALPHCDHYDLLVGLGGLHVVDVSVLFTPIRLALPLAWKTVCRQALANAIGSSPRRGLDQSSNHLAPRSAFAALVTASAAVILASRPNQSEL